MTEILYKDESRSSSASSMFPGVLRVKGYESASSRLSACERIPGSPRTAGILPAITGLSRLFMPARCRRYNFFTSSQAALDIFDAI